MSLPAAAGTIKNKEASTQSRMATNKKAKTVKSTAEVEVISTYTQMSASNGEAQKTKCRCGSPRTATERQPSTRWQTAESGEAGTGWQTVTTRKTSWCRTVWQTATAG